MNDKSQKGAFDMKRYMICSLCVLLAALLTLGSMAALAEENKETVYVLADALGQPQRVFVNERQPEGETGAEEAPEGEIALPVRVGFRYELDGAPIEPADLAGKSGHLTVYVDYASNLTCAAEVKGETVEMPIPFLAATVLPLDEDVFSNVEVTNGHVINAGRVSAVVCIGMPGLSEALDMSDNKDISLGFNIPIGAVISADVVNYASDGCYTVVTGLPQDASDAKPSVDIKFKGFKVNSEIAKGMMTSGASEMLKGVGDLATGADSLAAGAGTLNTGAAALSEGLTQLSGNSAALTEGADQIIGGILDTVNETLNASAAALSQADIELNPLTLDNYAAELDRIEGALMAAAQAQGADAGQQATEASAAGSEIVQTLEALRGRLDGVKAFRDGLTGYTAGVDQAAQGAEAVATGASELDAGSTKLAAGAKKLDGSVQAIMGYLDGDVKEMLDRVKALANLHYDGYLDKSAESTLFIIRTAGV